MGVPTNVTSIVYNIFSYKYNNTKPLMLEYPYQLKGNLQLEKQISVTTGRQKAFEKKSQNNSATATV